MALTLGLRKGEALALQWRDIDFANRTLRVRRSLQIAQWEHGCGDQPCGHSAGYCPAKHGGGAIAKETKTRAGNRTIGLPAAVVQTLRGHQVDQRREQEQAGNLWHDGGWTFTNPLGRPIHPRTDHNEWKALLKAAKVRNARLHDARHTAATMLLALGVPSRAVMDVMGWSHIGMTTRYQHVTSDIVQEIADRVETFYWSTGDDPGGPQDGTGGVPTRR